MVTDSFASLPQAPAWGFRALADQLPDGLPPGALTVIRLPNQPLRRGPWTTAVGQLLLDTLDRCRPAVYTYADEPTQPWPEAGINPLGPHYRGVRDACGCCPPSHDHFAARHHRLPLIAPSHSTLDNLTTALADHEQRHGPSLVILDNVERARPYAYLPGGALHRADPPDAVARRANSHRAAADLLAFATSRPAAPTVVVCKDEVDGPSVAAFAEVALVMLAARSTERHRPVTLQVRSRCSVQVPWPPATEIVLPWFDWGFDDRDLDAEDAQALDQENARAAGEQSDPDPTLPADPWAVSAPRTGGNA